MSNDTFPTVGCQKCGRRYRWKPEFAGHKIACFCGQQFVLPKTPAEILPQPVPAAMASPTETTGNLSLNQIHDLLQEDLLAEAGDVADAPRTNQTDLDPTPPLSPNCKAYWAAGGTFCLRCGYVLESKEADSDVE